jgi:hypothetical protein
MTPTNRSVRLGKVNKSEPSIVNDQNNTDETIGTSDRPTIAVTSHSVESFEVNEGRIDKRG